MYDIDNLKSKDFNQFEKKQLQCSNQEFANWEVINTHVKDASLWYKVYDLALKPSLIYEAESQTKVSERLDEEEKTNKWFICRFRTNVKT